MSGRSRSTSRTVGTNSTARARAVAPVYATRASPYPFDCSNDARASAASTSSSTTNIRGRASGGQPLCFLDCVGCIPTAACSTEAHRTRVLVARFEALDLPFGFVARDAIRLFKFTRKTRAVACNQVEMGGGEPAPVCVYFVPEVQPARLHEIPVHQTLPGGPVSLVTPVFCSQRS